ncbi:Methylisocitrate lyase [Pseudonocardia sp. Ae168_Ps1]|uniref:methylisocitrate lyase n=1 Tax=unclassified Pseudonocardia TaxID=2619320 RepID=UPI00094B43E8|nr:MULTISPECIES: methylisocitrate lyase [unclassified Pseudonocardia]OLL74452.1 Methylisocitrate lyase [Pseudonocardia sp. Ae150A_Ps1]OLL80432.1 Methylisocitrate lyase [Pseudonocardia sp. Ae168_Ps1]OLL85441.1 Methylisocitrate lyase [Pseudonocardia sp. Ae263_Ps1]OLL94532.1 Methylisocitrate lyase [Pseudonocardia sp. Ae356_Ps1]
MLGTTTTAHERRVALREALASGRLLQFPGAFNALSAQLIAEQGFDGVYVSGAMLSAELGRPDVGLTTATEVAGRAATIARATGLPTLVDADTGWGGPANVARTIQTFEDAGVSGCHLEDQIDQKRCGHLSGKELVSTDDMCTRIRAAVRGRRDEAFVLCARTDARAVEGLDAAIARARSYVEAGADMVFAEALTSPDEYAAFRDALDVPLLANMTEFGRSPLLDTVTLEKLGVNVVIYPVTLLRLAMGAAEAGLAEIRRTGTQAGVVDRMQTRARLYELIRYDAYGEFDATLAGHLDEEDPA